MTKIIGMGAKVDHIKELNKSVTSILQEVISLKETIKLHENTIKNLTNKKHQITKDLEASMNKLSHLNIENATLTAEKKEAEIINKELVESINQLKIERKKLVFQLADL